MVALFQALGHVRFLVLELVRHSALGKNELAVGVVVKPIISLHETNAQHLASILDPPPHDTVEPNVENQNFWLFISHALGVNAVRSRSRPDRGYDGRGAEGNAARSQKDSRRGRRKEPVGPRPCTEERQKVAETDLEVDCCRDLTVGDASKTARLEQ